MRVARRRLAGIVLVPVYRRDRRFVRGHEVLERGHDGGEDRVADLDLRYGGCLGVALEVGVGGGQRYVDVVES